MLEIRKCSVVFQKNKKPKRQKRGQEAKESKTHTRAVILEKHMFGFEHIRTHTDTHTQTHTHTQAGPVLRQSKTQQRYSATRGSRGGRKKEVEDGRARKQVGTETERGRR